MKILCVSDHVDPLVYSNGIKARFQEVSLVLSCGDLPLSYYDFIMSSLNKPLLFVFGNHNLSQMKDYRSRCHSWSQGDFREPPTGATYIGKRVAREKGLLIAGLGGSRWYNGEENQFTDFQMTLRILPLIPALLFNRIFRGRYLDVLVTHAPPFGIHDRPDPCHRGFKAFLWFMEVFRPAFLIHGHIHLYSSDEQRVSRYRGTTVVNAYNHTILEVEVRRE